MHGRSQQFSTLAALIPKALPTTGRGSWRISRLQTTQMTTSQRIFYSVPCLVSQSEPWNPGDKRLFVPYHTLQPPGLNYQKATQQNTKRCQRSKTEELGALCTEVITVSHLLPGSSFVAFSCFFTLTLYSFSILLNVSSDKRANDFSSAHKSRHHQVPHRDISHRWSSNTRATPKSHSRQKSFCSSLWLNENQSEFPLQNSNYWKQHVSGEPKLLSSA